jgi:NADH dehydrogenase/NADH:ubiquinone oxidoreductase subunit G
MVNAVSADRTAVKLRIDETDYQIQEGITLLDACLQTNHYVPALCAHPDLPTVGECGLCIIKISTQEEPVLACAEKVSDGISILSSSPELQKLRQKRLSQILKDHPHVCLTCPHQDGCDRTECTLGFSIEERCCSQFGKCEIQKVSHYIEISPDTPPYRPSHLPIWEKDPVIRLNLELCIGCMRCVDVCSKVMGYNALSSFIFNSRSLVKPMKADLTGTSPSGANPGAGFKESGCRFCGACVEVCPAGAVIEYGKNGSRWREKTKSKLNFSSLPVPPSKTISLESSNLSFVPNEPGVYRLWNEKGELFAVEGSPNLKNSLKEEIENQKNGFGFDFEVVQFYTQRANELLQSHLKRSGKLPDGNEILDDLY